MSSATRLAYLVLVSTAMLLVAPSPASAGGLWMDSPSGSNDNNSSTGGSSTPFGCGVTAPEPPFVLAGNITLKHSTESIAIFNSTTYTGYVYSYSLLTGTALPPINISLGASAFPPMGYPGSVFQLRADATGRLHIVDWRNYVVICMTLDAVWQSLIPVPSTGLWSFDISPDGETYYINALPVGSLTAVDRKTGATLPFNHQPTSSAVSYGPDGSIWLANEGSTIDRLDSRGNVLSSISLAAYSDLKLDISGMVVDARSNFIFTNRQGSNCNDLCVLFPASANLYCWEAVAGYDFGLAYDAVADQVTCIRGADDGALFTFAAPKEDTIVKQAEAAPMGLAGVIKQLRQQRMAGNA